MADGTRMWYSHSRPLQARASRHPNCTKLGPAIGQLCQCLGAVALIPRVRNSVRSQSGSQNVGTIRV